MIVKFFKHGSGDGKAAFNYLLNDRVEEGTSKILRGSADITKSIISSLKTKKKYKSGCLSFEEQDISIKKKNEIMDLFEKTIFPGMPSDNRNICWVEHTDKNRLELNFVIPRVELFTNKAFNPYYDRTDRNRMSAFRDYVNTKYKLSNPMDASKQQSLKLGDLVKYKRVEVIKHLDSYIQKLVKKGILKNQSDVVNELKNIGYTISRVSSEYISIKTDTSKPIRLKGKFYSSTWENEPIPAQNSKELFNKLNQYIKKASAYNIAKYYCNLKIDSKTIVKKYSNVATKKNLLSL